MKNWKTVHQGPHSHVATLGERWEGAIPLHQPYSPVCPRLHLASFTHCPCLLLPVSLRPAPAPPSCLLWHLFLPNRNPGQEGLTTGCPTGLACPWLQTFAHAVLSAWNGFPQISARCYKPSSGEGLECRVQGFLERVTIRHFSLVQWCHTLSKLNIVNLLQGTTSREKTQHPRLELPRKNKAICIPERFKVNPIGD